MPTRRRRPKLSADDQKIRQCLILSTKISEKHLVILIDTHILLREIMEATLTIVREGAPRRLPTISTKDLVQSFRKHVMTPPIFAIKKHVAPTTWKNWARSADFIKAALILFMVKTALNSGKSS